MTRLDPADLQGNILRGYPQAHSGLPVRGRGRRRRRPGLAGRARPGGHPRVGLFRAICRRRSTSPLTYEGSRPCSSTRRSSTHSRMTSGAAWRPGARSLGERRPQRAPSEMWRTALGRGEGARPGHAVRGREGRARAAPARVRDTGGARGPRAANRGEIPHRADISPGRASTFGFADGFSQPAVEGSGRPAHGAGVQQRFRRWRHLRLASSSWAIATRTASCPGRDRAPAAQRHVHGVAQARPGTSRCSGAG
jgi:hypothetical protein